MILLPDDDEILDVVCGDRDFWVISATHNIAHIKPAKEGAATNLNLVTGSGAVYSFLLSEKGGNTTPDLKVYVTPDPSEARGKPKYYTAAQFESVQAEISAADKQFAKQFYLKNLPSSIQKAVRKHFPTEFAGNEPRLNV